MAETRPTSTKQDWKLPLAVGVGGTVLASVILGALHGLTGALGRLSFGHFMLWVALPAAGVSALCALGLWVWRLRSEIDAAAQSSAETAATLSKHARALQRLALADVIQTAKVNKWTVDDDEDGLLFKSPDDDRCLVKFEQSDPMAVAGELANLAPSHFSDDWRQYLPTIGSDALIGRRGVEDLKTRLDALEHGLPRRLREASLATIAAEARAWGWEAEWHDWGVRFVNPKRSEMATFRYDDEDVDLARLRKALGLTGLGQPW